MATFSLTGQLRIQPSVTDTLATTDVVDSVEIIRPLTLTNGTGPGQANAYWRDVRTVTGSASESLTVSSPLPVSIFGGAGSVAFDAEKMRLFYIRNLSTTATLALRLVDSDELALPPGGILLLTWPTNEPFATNNGNDLVVRNTATGPANYEIVLAGVKAT